MAIILINKDTDVYVDKGSTVIQYYCGIFDNDNNIYKSGITINDISILFYKNNNSLSTTTSIANNIKYYKDNEWQIGILPYNSEYLNLIIKYIGNLDLSYGYSIKLKYADAISDYKLNLILDIIYGAKLCIVIKCFGYHDHISYACNVTRINDSIINALSSDYILDANAGEYVECDTDNCDLYYVDNPGMAPGSGSDFTQLDLIPTDIRQTYLNELNTGSYSVNYLADIPQSLLDYKEILLYADHAYTISTIPMFNVNTDIEDGNTILIICLSAY